VQSCEKNTENIKEKIVDVSNDSINIYINSSKNDSYSVSERKTFLKQAYKNLKSSEIDSIKTRLLSILAYQNLKFGDTLLFRKQNKEALTIAKKVKDSFAIGDIHWNYASYFNGRQMYDSAYYHFYLAHGSFNKSGYLYGSAKTQYGMAFIKGRYKDYSGSEVLTFKAIHKFEKLENYKSLFSCYNHLGTLQNDIYEYDRSLFYYNIALEYLEKLDSNQIEYADILNNIGNTYLKKGDYRKAIEYFNKVLDIKPVKLNNISHYARVLSNKAYARLLTKDTINVAKNLVEALKIRDSLNHKGGVVISKIHLAHYFAYKQDTSKAISYAKEANNLAKGIKNSRDYLESLSLLANLDTKFASKYLGKHIKFSDSIQIVDRKIQNKFTRIAYETDEYKEETKRLSKEKLWILGTSFGLISILGLLYFIKREKSKNEKLLFENEEQKANEQIYLISLKQQEKLEKEKIKERNRIAEELHDGILSKLFGTRVGLGFLDIEGDEELKVKHQLFLKELQIIEKDIREVSHKLSDNFDSTQISFTTIIRQLSENKSKIGNFKYDLNFDECIPWQDIDERIKVNLYRIIQEALQNITKYAAADYVSITFLLKTKNLEVIIKDDGIGFNLRQKKKGIGIKNMTSRVKKINGIISIDSKLNEGVLIRIRIPI
jgi:signal transduction histidine kinase